MAKPGTPGQWILRGISWRRWPLWLLALVPLVVCGLLVRTYCVNQRFLDDWMFVPDLMKFHEGTLCWSDLWAAQMEHRSPLPRLLALGAALAFHGDLRALNALSFLQACGLAAMAWVLLRRGARATGGAASPWLLALMLMVLCSPVQSQPLLWAVLFFAWTPVFFLGVAICVVTWEELRWGWKLAGWLACAVAASLSFASGFLVWVLPWLALWPAWQGKAAWRWRMAASWALVLAMFCFVYFHDIHNQVDAAFAYGQGGENVVANDLAKATGQLPRIPAFVLAFTGAALSRGFFYDHIPTAMVLGGLLLLGWAAVAVYVCWGRREASLRRAVLPWLALGAYTPLMAGMVAVGRLWVGSTIAPALYGRYAMHQSVLTWSLVPALALVLADQVKSRPGSMARASTTWVPGLCGALVVLLMSGWAYGIGLMEQWRAARLRNAATQLFTGFKPTPDYFCAAECPPAILNSGAVAFLDKHHYLDRPLLTSRNLSTFPPKTALRATSGALTDLRRVGPGLEADGYALRPRRRRTFDIVLFTYRNQQGESIIFGLTQPVGVPIFVRRAMAKDLDFTTSRRLSDPADFGAWIPTLSLFEPPPDDLLKVEAWALDIERFQVHRLSDQRTPIPSDRNAPG